MKSLDPKVYQALTESIQTRHDMLNSHLINIPEYLMLRQLQDEWDEGNEDLIAA